MDEYVIKIIIYIKYDIFISYSRKDFEEVYSFIEFIKSRINNIACWFDLDGIESGEQFTRHIIDAIVAFPFEYGIGVEKDIDKAISLYRRAVNNGWYYADADLKRLGVN